MDPVPLFATRTEANGQRVVSGLEPIFNSRLNPGNNLLIRITVSRYSRYYIVGSSTMRSSCCGRLLHSACCGMLLHSAGCNCRAEVLSVTMIWRMLQVNVLVPIILSTLLGFSVFLIQFDDIEKRLGECRARGS